MTTRFFGASLAAIAAAFPLTAFAQDAALPPQPEEGITDAREIVVQAEIGYRNRNEDSAEPVLVYDTEYFQRFEPLTAGDALKRVPSVTFLSDVIESDGARLRGLPPGYTQILINGEKVPGSNDDRSFFLDRIPAELIERVEIVRSSSARRTGDAVAGSLNIELRDALQLDGGYVKLGGLYFDDEELEPSLGLVYGGALGPGRVLFGANLQGRHNPKLKSSFRYGDSPENDPDFLTNEFDNREDQTDTRDGKDYSANLSYAIDGATTDLELGAYYVRTDRTETERSFEYDDPTAITGPLPGGNLLSDNDNVNEIDQENYTLDGKLDHEWSLGETSLRVSFARFEDKQREVEVEIDFDTDEDPPVLEQVFLATDIVDKEFSAKLEHAFSLGENAKFIVGAFYQDKDRRTSIAEFEDDFDLDGVVPGYNQAVDSPLEFADAFGTPEPIDGGLNRLEERRIDGFALVEGKSGIATWEAGVRYESTRLTIEDFTGTVADGTARTTYQKLLPSASIKLDLTPRDRITASVARTSRRPEFNFLSPALLEEEVADNDLLGNPDLQPETAWGIDVGYERRLGARGIAGLNVFYRDVSDLIELTNTGVEGSEGDGTFVFTPQNVGDGKVWGVEFDLSSDLGFLGLPDTGVFGNVSLLDSEITDIFGTRRFNDQSKFVYNFGAIQTLRSLGASFGATYRKQGRAFGRVIGEEVTTSYGADLEVFVEKRFGDKFTIRAVGSNLLNGKKREVFNKFDNIEDQQERNFDEYELEAEEAGPVFQLVARYAF
jgi:outer membrane receptor protein involved in Fe transport